MIHLFLTNSELLRDAAIAHYELGPAPLAESTYRRNDIILIYRAELTAEVLVHGLDHFVPGTIWILAESRLVSTDHQIGDVVLPNVFLHYNHEIDGVEFTRTNRDEFLEDPLFLHHFDEQADLDFEHFGVSIGGITVTKPDGMDAVDREQLEFAYSADCVEEVCYPIIREALSLDRAEDVFPVLVIMDRDSDPEQALRYARNALPVVDYLKDVATANADSTVVLDDDFEVEQ